jgi:hypothetical protein
MDADWDDWDYVPGIVTLSQFPKSASRRYWTLVPCARGARLESETREIAANGTREDEDRLGGFTFHGTGLIAAGLGFAVS